MSEDEISRIVEAVLQRTTTHGRIEREAEQAQRSPRKKAIAYLTLAAAIIGYVFQGHAWLMGKLRTYRHDVETEAISVHESKKQAELTQRIIEANQSGVQGLSTRVSGVESRLGEVETKVDEIHAVVVTKSRRRR